MKNKGFTLIELLAVIVIVSIIFVIVLPIVTNQIEEIKIKAYIQNENAVIKAAELYMHRNINSIPTNDYETFEVSIKELQEQKYLKAIKNPNNRKENCSGYVIVIKMESGNHEYIPHVKCGSKKKINNTWEDDLVAHYLFWDFQEPTINIFDFDVNDRCWSSANSDACKSKQTTGKQSFVINGTSNVFGAYAYVYPYFDTVVNSSHSLSAKVKNNSNETLKVSLRIRDDNNGDALSDTVAYNILAGEEKYVSVSTNKNNKSNVITGTISIFSNNDNGNMNAEIYDIQMERKGYNTPYVEDARKSYIYDFSSNENNSELLLDSTPKWVDKSYEFNGTNNYIILNDKLNNFGNAGDFTIMAWVKANDSDKRAIVTSGYMQAAYGRFGLFSDGVYVRDNENNHIHANYNKHLDGKWHQLVGLFSRSDQNITFIVDGKKRVTKEWEGMLANHASGIVSLGNLKKPEGKDSYYFKGLIKDVKLYNRSLTLEEINHQYELKSNIYGNE